MATYSAKVRVEGVDNTTVSLNADGQLQVTNAPVVYTATSAATLTPNTDVYDQYHITAQSEDITIADCSNSPKDAEKMIVRIKDDGTGRGITFGDSYRGVGETLPTTTTSSKTLYMGFIWNATDSKMDLVAVSEEA